MLNSISAFFFCLSYFFCQLDLGCAKRALSLVCAYDKRHACVVVLQSSSFIASYVCSISLDLTNCGRL